MLTFLFPGSILFLASLLCVGLDALGPRLGIVSGIYPAAVFFACAAYGLRFNRSGPLYGALCTAAVLWFLKAPWPVHGAWDLRWRLAYCSCSVLLPLDLCALCLLRERGVFTRHGIFRLFVLAAQPLMVAMAARGGQARLVEALEQDILPWSFPSFLKIPEACLLSGLAGLILCAAAYALRKGAREAGFFWALCACLAAFASGPDRDAAAFHLAGSSLILLVSMVELSHAMAFKDELTGLPGRRALKEEFSKLGPRYCLAMVDIDHFKKFNDTHGHDAGDQVLRMVASRLARVGGGGRAFRYGGEEFAIVFQGRHAVGAHLHLEELRSSLASSDFVIRSASRTRRRKGEAVPQGGGRRRVAVTVSIGAAASGAARSAPEEVLKAADKALYRAKKKGRNRVEVSGRRPRALRPRPSCAR